MVPSRGAAVRQLHAVEEADLTIGRREHEHHSRWGCGRPRHNAEVERRILVEDRPLEADIRQWLPGDSVYENTIPVPWDVKPGKYRLRVALLDPNTHTPVIQLAITGRQSDGWYDLGDITVD